MPKYSIDLPERHDIITYLGECNKPRTLEHIAEALNVDAKAARRALEKRLRAMQRDGQIIKNRRGGFGLVEKMDLLKGRVIGHPDGFGFLKLDNGSEDLFLPPREMRSLLHNDHILVRIVGIDKKGKPEVSVVEILERANQQIVGRYRKKGKVGFVEPDNNKLHQDVLVPSTRNKAQPGDYVVVEIVEQPDRHTQPVGRIKKVLGSEMNASLAVDMALLTHEIPADWPASVEKAACRFSEETDSADSKGREDLRDLPFVTIDGEDARDFDDAVYCRKTKNGWQLMVAIADVSHYVKPGKPLDKEAVNRGNSVYFPRRVIPMLPEVLSNGLCSLNPDVDRLCLACEMEINNRGEMTAYRFLEGVIRSAARLTYTKVAAILIEKDKQLRKSHKTLLPHLEDLYQLYQLMHRHRASQAIIDFGSTEPGFEFDQMGRLKSIHTLERNDAHRLIEEFMLAANVATARFLQENEIPALYRVHETPKEDKLADLHSFLGELGLSLECGEEPTAKDYADLIDRIRERDDRHLIETVLLRSLPLAVYSAVNKGHFGLAFEAYTHFTSPIRRYPDLLVHRAVRHLLQHKSAKDFRYNQDEMAVMADQCSMTERRAEEATREIIQWYKCDFMKEKVGEEFDGTISGVTAFGLFVELDDIYVEGLIHVTALPIDYYHFDPVGHRLQGERTGRKYRLANRVRVKVTRVDVDDKKIDFELLEE